MYDVTSRFGRSGLDGDTWKLNVAVTTTSGVVILERSLMFMNALLEYCYLLHSMLIFSVIEGRHMGTNSRN